MTTAVEQYQKGGVIAYPTEAVFGLGCDPDNIVAVKKLLQIKNRPRNKGLILLASDYSQLRPYIDENKLSDEQLTEILSHWPNGITQLLPRNEQLSEWLCGDFKSIAVRITDQPDVVALCEKVGKPIVSTSANLSGEEPAKCWQDISPLLAKKLDFIIKGQTLGYNLPSTIIDVFTGDIVRP